MNFTDYVFCLFFFGVILSRLGDAEDRAATRHAQVMEAARRCPAVAR